MTATLADLRESPAFVEAVSIVDTNGSSTPQWNLDEVAGRLVEVSGSGASCAMSFALLLVHDAQARGEPVAWITTTGRIFLPSDAAAAGIDLEALIVVRAKGVHDVMRAADRLVRSGSLGLCVLDVQVAFDAAGRRVQVPMAAPSRLAGLARRHETGVVCLTEKSARAASLGSLVSLRLHATRGAIDEDGEACCRLDVIKDRRRGGRWTHEEVFRAPDGLR